MLSLRLAIGTLAIFMRFALVTASMKKKEQNVRLMVVENMSNAAAIWIRRTSPYIFFHADLVRRATTCPMGS